MNRVDSTEVFANVVLSNIGYTRKWSFFGRHTKACRNVYRIFRCKFGRLSSLVPNNLVWFRRVFIEMTTFFVRLKVLYPNNVSRFCLQNSTLHFIHFSHSLRFPSISTRSQLVFPAFELHRSSHIFFTDTSSRV